MKTLLASIILVLLAGFALATDTPNIGPYQEIIDKSPFGGLTAAGAAVVQPAFSERFQFVGIVTSNQGAGPVQAIIFDKDKTLSHFTAEGEDIAGVEPSVKVIRIENPPHESPKIVLRCFLETATLTFQDRSPVTPAAAPRQPFMPGAQPSPNPAGVATPRRAPFIRPR